MPNIDRMALLWMGGIFILLGIIAFIWGKIEEKNYYNAISTRNDAREFLEHWPFRPQFGALKIGGIIAGIIGLLMVIISFILWLRS
ncbi:MAG: hypothetical protein HY662_02000 [Chloroflexi bacterium]|nr:hypothetical protein [Chloroflexota bacterium]